MEDVKRYCVQTADGQTFWLSHLEAIQSSLLREMIFTDEEDEEEDEEEEKPTEKVYPLLRIHAASFARIHSFLTRHARDPMILPKKPVPFDYTKCGCSAWDIGFVSALSALELKEMLADEVVLDIPALHALLCSRVAWFHYGKTYQDLAASLHVTLPPARDDPAEEAFFVSLVAQKRIHSHSSKSVTLRKAYEKEVEAAKQKQGARVIV